MGARVSEEGGRPPPQAVLRTTLCICPDPDLPRGEKTAPGRSVGGCTHEGRRPANAGKKNSKSSTIPSAF